MWNGAGNPVVRGIELVPVDMLPDQFRAIFPYPLFNAVQSRCFDAAYNTLDNLVVSAPTGSGKTVILELAICGLLKSVNQGTYKVIYLAPTKALCSERRKDWEKKFRSLGLVCTELTGDTDQAQMASVRRGDLIVTTPEKWDSMTRRWEDHRKLLDLVRLFLIDEVHILKESRGATLEVVVSRMRSIGSDVRFVALSATIPNAGDIAAWLGRRGDISELPAQLEEFGPEFRPVKLEKHVYGYQSYANDFAFDKTLDQKLPGVLQKHAAGKPVMIFCMTRNICVSTAKLIADNWTKTPARERSWFAPKTELAFRDKELQAAAACGVAYHHAGLEVNDRMLIEKEYLEGGLMVICCTSTLAVGVNLPAHLVVIKNTVCWTDGGTKEYADLEIMQMLGRAGRPQFDDTGVAVIMTRKEKVEKFEKMESGMEILESCLHKNLIEHLNAEIGMKMITDSWSAQQWLKSTFLNIRLKKNPAYYKLEGTSKVLKSEKRLEDICEKDITLLTNEGLVERMETQLKCTMYGECMARYYMRFGTMVKIMKMKLAPRIPEILTTLTEAEEFTELRFRSGEKGLYKDLNKGNDIKYPLKEELVTPAHKIYILLQFEMGSQDYPLEQQYQKLKASMAQDKTIVFRHVHRIIHCIVDCLIHKEDGIGVNNALELARSLKARVWEGSVHELRQLEGLGPVAVRRLVLVGVRSLKMLEMMPAHQIEATLSRNPPMGTNLLKKVKCIPRFTAALEIVGKLEYTATSVIVKLKAKIGYLNEAPPTRFRDSVIYGTFVVLRSDGHLVSFNKLPVHQLEGGKEIKFSATLTEHGQALSCFLSCEQIGGLDAVDMKGLSWLTSRSGHDGRRGMFPQDQPEFQVPGAERGEDGTAAGAENTFTAFSEAGDAKE
ncbi:putative DEAD/DEAH box DNA helicase [Ascodesmis nigricans]|uniref:DNA 3'-5' helicase n=1 Tax=Ascodesmis nigricans TaxID=341454 RepID=A0A4V6RHB2_9PEZI|nr:putative DEAD/DEAH box DNA helicase [Ascodesmis nigricans]